MSKQLKASMTITSHQTDNINKEIEVIKMNQIEILKSSLTEMKNSIEVLSRNLSRLRRKIGEHEDRSVEVIQSEEKKEKEKVMKKTEQSPRDLWVTIKQNGSSKRRGEGRKDIGRNNGRKFPL